MGLMAPLEKTLNDPTATATTATHDGGVTVATVAATAVTTETYEILHIAPQLNERVQFLIGRGITLADATKLSDKLSERDCTLDDRRACAECANWFASRCKLQLFPIGDADLFTLHRCYKFWVAA